jgi:hypothetical protein
MDRNILNKGKRDEEMQKAKKEGGIFHATSACDNLYINTFQRFFCVAEVLK